MFEKYFNEKGRHALEKRRHQLGPDALLKAQQDWQRVKQEVRDAMQRGVEPSTPEAKALGARWKGLVEQFTGGDAEVTAGLKEMHHKENGLGKVLGNDDKMIQWINKAIGR